MLMSGPDFQVCGLDFCSRTIRPRVIHPLMSDAVEPRRGLKRSTVFGLVRFRTSSWFPWQENLEVIAQESDAVEPVRELAPIAGEETRAAAPVAASERADVQRARLPTNGSGWCGELIDLDADVKSAEASKPLAMEDVAMNSVEKGVAAGLERNGQDLAPPVVLAGTGAEDLAGRTAKDLVGQKAANLVGNKAEDLAGSKAEDLAGSKTEE
eukprot:6208542-Pleurochrysis_carterae.AAC.1